MKKVVVGEIFDVLSLQVPYTFDRNIKLFGGCARYVLAPVKLEVLTDIDKGRLFTPGFIQNIPRIHRRDHYAGWQVAEALSSMIMCGEIGVPTDYSYIVCLGSYGQRGKTVMLMYIDLNLGGKIQINQLDDCRGYSNRKALTIIIA